MTRSDLVRDISRKLNNRTVQRKTRQRGVHETPTMSQLYVWCKSTPPFNFYLINFNMILNKDLKLDLELEEELRNKGINTDVRWYMGPCYYDDGFVFLNK